MTPAQAARLAQRDLDRLRDLDQQCREASEEADREKAGMREVALFRAANAKAVMGGYAVSLAERLVAALEKVAALDAMRGTPDDGAIAEAEQRGYERGRRDFQFQPSGDNHHNAALCPYCSPKAAPDDGAIGRVLALAATWEDCQETTAGGCTFRHCGREIRAAIATPATAEGGGHRPFDPTEDGGW